MFVRTSGNARVSILFIFLPGSEKIFSSVLRNYNVLIGFDAKGETFGDRTSV